MSLQNMELPDHIVHGEELDEVWDNMMSLANAVIGEVGVVVEPVVEPEVGEYKVIRFAA